MTSAWRNGLSRHADGHVYGPSPDKYRVGVTGVNLVGYLNHVIGLGESARQFAGALRAAGVPHALAAMELAAVVPQISEPHVPWLGDAVLPYDVTVLWCNPDRYGVDVEPAAIAGDRLVARWAWELPELPAEWCSAATPLCEIWTASRFVANAVSKSVAVPVRVIPQAIAVSPAPPLDRDRWNVPTGHALFAFMFDHHSIAARKNALGLVAAFTEAFPPGRNATLLIKTINAATYPETAAELVAAASGHPAIQVVDIALPASERAALLAGCDCYVSLHRSEGFGLTIAEAMAYGRPVVATGFGGNVDYIDDETGYLVRSTLTPVGEGVPVYPADGVWAEPDLSHAAQLLRSVLADPADAAARGRRAARRIATDHAPAVVGAAVARELARVSRT
jgi:glycosyltransferase involved in cell wall biosynthesis